MLTPSPLALTFCPSRSRTGQQIVRYALVDLVLARGAVDLPVTRIQRVDPGPLLLPRQAVPDRREGEELTAIHDHTPRRAEWLVDGEDLARGPGDHFGLEPAVLGTTPGV